MSERNKFWVKVGVLYVVLAILGNFIPTLNEDFIQFWCVIYAVVELNENMSGRV